MADRTISKIRITNMQFGTEGGQTYVNADVHFATEGTAEIVAKIGIDVDIHMTLQDMRLALARDAHLFFSSGAEIADGRLAEMIETGSRSWAD